MYKFICKECGTRFTSAHKEPPPGIKWDDGHFCSPVSVDTDEEKIRAFVEQEYPNALSAVKDFLVEGIHRYQIKIINKDGSNK